MGQQNQDFLGIDPGNDTRYGGSGLDAVAMDNLCGELGCCARARLSVVLIALPARAERVAPDIVEVAMTNNTQVSIIILRIIIFLFLVMF